MTKENYVKQVREMLSWIKPGIDLVKKYANSKCPRDIYAPLYDVIDGTLSHAEYLLEDETSEEAKGLVKKLEEIGEEWEPIRWPENNEGEKK